jgi:uncharacterized protein YkwD
LRLTNKFLFVFLASALLFLSGCVHEDGDLVGVSNANETEVEAASFNLINEDRIKAGLPALVWDPQIAAVARAHSADMRNRNFYSHTNPDGQDFAARLRSAGLSFRTAGENLARTTNVSNPATSANAEFLQSEGHRKNLLNPSFTRVGVGVSRSGNTYWITQNFTDS